MRIINIPLMVLAALSLLLTSCLSDDDTEETYYGDTAITSFSLGTLTRTVHTTTSSGADSTYTATVTGGNYRFYIDQINRQIYNVDSLPSGTNVSRVLATIDSKNGGQIYIKSLISDSLFYYNSDDSLDFSSPRQIAVFSMSNSNTTVRADYTVTVNVHKEEAGQFVWSLKGTVEGFQNSNGMKAYSAGGTLFAFVSTGSTTNIYTSSETDGTNWSLINPYLEVPIPADGFKNTALSNEWLYIFMNGKLLRSKNASTWETVSKPKLSQLIGGGTYELFGINTYGRLVASYDEGKTWQEESTAENSYLIPTKDVSVTIRPSIIHDNTETVVIAGNRDVTLYPAESHAVVWNKVSEKGKMSKASDWIFADASDFPNYQLPRLDQLVTTNYNDGILALGGNGIGGCTLSPFLHFYYSNNGGLYWTVDSQYNLPSDFSASNSSFTLLSDGDQHLWMLCGGSGQVWCGNLSDYGWDEPITSFTE